MLMLHKTHQWYQHSHSSQQTMFWVLELDLHFLHCQSSGSCLTGNKYHFVTILSLQGSWLFFRAAGKGKNSRHESSISFSGLRGRSRNFKGGGGGSGGIFFKKGGGGGGGRTLWTPPWISPWDWTTGLKIDPQNSFLHSYNNCRSSSKAVPSLGDQDIYLVRCNLSILPTPRHQTNCRGALIML